MEAGAIRPGYELWRPNRDKPEAQSARALVVLLLLVTAALTFVIVIGGWTRLEGVKPLSILYAGLYVLFAFLVARWNRGVLPVAAALSIILAIFAGIAAPAWFDRAKEGLSNPALPPDLLGILCLVLVPIQVVLIAVAMVAFNQGWHVEEERPIGDEVPPEDEDQDSRRDTSEDEDRDSRRDTSEDEDRSSRGDTSEDRDTSEDEDRSSRGDTSDGEADSDSTTRRDSRTTRMTGMRRPRRA